MNVYGVLVRLAGWLNLLDIYADYASLFSMKDVLDAWLYTICSLVN